MAKKADNKPAATERVTFTSGAADRIAKVVRTVEGGDRDCDPLTFGARIGGVSGKAFRVCTFTGAWSINATKTVTFKNQTATPNTVAVVNLFYPVTSTAAGSTDCAIAKDGTAWYLIDVPLESASTTVITDVTLSASLNTSACTISIGKTLVTASISFLRLRV
jgi:hypothetical protein